MIQEPVEAVTDPPRWPQFRLVHIVYIVTLLASAMALFSAHGLMVGGVICAFWASVFVSRNRRRAFINACVIFVLFPCLVYVLWPASGAAREAPRRFQCANNMKQIGVALHNYHDVYGSLPPAYTADERGKPKHSWRVLILPFIDQQALYDKYNFDEPWNGRHNRQLIDSIPSVYRCPSSRDNGNGQTSYVAVVGANTAWPESSMRTLSQISDGTSNTVMVMECDDQEILWLEPVDLGFDEALSSVTSDDLTKVHRHYGEDLLRRYSYVVRGILFADGHVGYAQSGVRREVWSALLTINDGVPWKEEDLEGVPIVSTSVNVSGVLRLVAFIVLTVLPLPWVYLNPNRNRNGSESN